MKLQILVGPISSGKTTYSLNAARQGFLCLNDDAIVNLLHGNDYTLYDKKLKPLYKTIENQIIGTVLAMNRSLIIDRGLNCSLQGRKRWIALANSFDVPCEAIIFKNEGPEIHAKRRTESDSRGYPFEYWFNVAKSHQTTYVEPTLDEGFDLISEISFEEIMQGVVVE